MSQLPAPTFDFWTLLFSGFAFIGLFYSSKLLVTNWSDIRNRILSLYLLLQSITILEYVFYWTRLVYVLPSFSEISLLFPLLYGPLLVIYFNESFGNSKPLKSYVFHFVPFVVLLGFKIPFYLADSQLKLFHTHNILFGVYFDYYPWLMLWHLSVYAVILILLIRNQSGIGYMRIWAWLLIGFFIAFLSLSFLYYILAFTGNLTSQSDYFISLTNCLTIFMIAWFGKSSDAVANGKTVIAALVNDSDTYDSVSSRKMIIQTSKIAAARQEEDTTEKYQHSGLPKSVSLKLIEDLERLMQHEKLYRENDLRLETLAEKLNSNKHFVSQVINQNLKMNFFEYINKKRIDEAKQLLKTTRKEDFNVIEIAYQVGFNNKGTFNSVFKKITGVTPSEFRKQSSQLLDTNNNQN